MCRLLVYQGISIVYPRSPVQVYKPNGSTGWKRRRQRDADADGSAYGPSLRSSALRSLASFVDRRGWVDKENEIGEGGEGDENGNHATGNRSRQKDRLTVSPIRRHFEAKGKKGKSAKMRRSSLLWPDYSSDSKDSEGDDGSRDTRACQVCGTVPNSSDDVTCEICACDVPMRTRSKKRGYRCLNRSRKQLRVGSLASVGPEGRCLRDAAAGDGGDGGDGDDSLRLLRPLESAWPGLGQIRPSAATHPDGGESDDDDWRADEIEWGHSQYPNSPWPQRQAASRDALPLSSLSAVPSRVPRETPQTPRSTAVNTLGRLFPLLDSEAVLNPMRTPLSPIIIPPPPPFDPAVVRLVMLARSTPDRTPIRQVRHSLNCSQDSAPVIPSAHLVRAELPTDVLSARGDGDCGSPIAFPETPDVNSNESASDAPGGAACDVLPLKDTVCNDDGNGTAVEEESDDEEGDAKEAAGDEKAVEDAAEHVAPAEEAAKEAAGPESQSEIEGGAEGEERAHVVAAPGDPPPVRLQPVLAAPSAAARRTRPAAITLRTFEVESSDSDTSTDSDGSNGDRGTTVGATDVDDWEFGGTQDNLIGCDTLTQGGMLVPAQGAWSQREVSTADENGERRMPSASASGDATLLEMNDDGDEGIASEESDKKSDDEQNFIGTDCGGDRGARHGQPFIAATRSAPASPVATAEDTTLLEDEEHEFSLDTPVPLKRIPCNTFLKRSSVVQGHDEHGLSAANLVCSVCDDDQADPGDDIITCNTCAVRVHPTCYGVIAFHVRNGSSWSCDACSVKPVAASTRARCMLCNVRGGALKRSVARGEEKLWAHVVCLLWTPELAVEGMAPKALGEVDPLRAETLRCSLCGGKGGVQCVATVCIRAVHPFCVRECVGAVSSSERWILADEPVVQGENSDFQLLCPRHVHLKRAPERSDDSPSCQLEPPSPQLTRASTGSSVSLVDTPEKAEQPAPLSRGSFGLVDTPSTGTKTPGARRPWACGQCTLQNPASVPACGACGGPNPGVVAEAGQAALGRRIRRARQTKKGRNKRPRESNGGGKSDSERRAAAKMKAKAHKAERRALRSAIGGLVCDEADLDDSGGGSGDEDVTESEDGSDDSFLNDAGDGLLEGTQTSEVALHRYACAHTLLSKYFVPLSFSHLVPCPVACSGQAV